MPVAGLLEEVVEIPDGVQLRVDGDFVVVTVEATPSGAVSLTLACGST